VTGLRFGGRETSLFDLIARPEYTVFVYEERPLLAPAWIGQRASYEAVVVFTLRVGDADAAEEAVVADPEGRFAKRYGLRSGWACAIRPDGYVGYRGPASGLSAYFSKWLLKGASQPRTAALSATAQ
jgi:hypothetical protein